MNKVALIIIYNHQYNKNIAILEQIYKNRFSNIFHLVPFYNGEKSNVIPVYDSSYCFQGYISQGFKNYFSEEFMHYFFVADDMILNPIINEKNYMKHLNLNFNKCFIPDFISLHEREKYWKRISEAFFWNIKYPGVEAVNQLPNYYDACEKFEKFGLEIKPLRFNQIWKTPTTIKAWFRPFFSKTFFKHNFLILRYLKSKFSGKTFSLSYPAVAGYSDIFVINANTIKDFCHYCGVFAATKLFVEVAIPTALILSSDEIVTEKDIELKGKALWTTQELMELEKYDNSLKKLSVNFPINYLYLHPIKLSKWQNDL